MQGESKMETQDITTKARNAIYSYIDHLVIPNYSGCVRAVGHNLNQLELEQLYLSIYPQKYTGVKMGRIDQQDMARSIARRILAEEYIDHYPNKRLGVEDGSITVEDF